MTLIFFSFAMPLFAGNYYWAGGGANANWTTVENWRIGSEAGTVATAYPTTGDTAFIAGDYTVTIDEDITVAALNIKKSGEAQFIVTDWTTKFTGSKKLTFGAMDFNRASSTDGVIGTLEIDCEATCSGELQTHSGTALIINSGSGKKLATNKLIHSAGDKKPKSQITVKGILAVTEDIKLQANGNNGCNSLYVDGGTVTAKNLTWDTNKTYENEGLDAINNSGTITLSGDLTATGPVTNSGTIKATAGYMAFADTVTNTGTLQTNAGAITFSGKVTGASGTIITTTGNITASAAAASSLGTVQSSGGTISNTGSGAVTLAELQMGADTSVTNSTGGALAITKLTGNSAATLTSGTSAITVSSYDGAPTIIAADGSIYFGAGTIAALTVDASASATIAGALTVTGDISNAGTLDASANLTFASDFTNTGTFTPAAGTTVTATGASASFTGNGASLPNFVYAPAATSGTGLAITDTNTITNFSCATANAKIAVNAANSFGTFSATGTGASITLSGAGAFTNLSVTSGGGTLTVNAEQTITGDLTLKGASGSPLNITGTGSLNIASNQSAGEYLSVAHTGPAIGGGSYFYTAGNSSFAAAPFYGQDKGWIFLDSPAEFVWTGATSADWAVASNWNYNMVPGLAGSAGVPATVGYPVKIPSAANQPELSGSVSYSVSDLTINAAAASLTLSSTGNVAASGTLTNKGTIVYSNTGRITDGTAFINDATNGGTVEFASASGAADLSTPTGGYYNLTINGSGSFTASAALTVANTLAVNSGDVYFNNGAGGTTTSAATAAFTTTGTVSLGNTSGDSFTVTGALALPPTLGGLELAGTITAGGGITFSKNAALAADTTFASAASLGAAVTLSGSHLVATNDALDTSAGALTLENASIENAAAVTSGNIIFTESAAAAQTFTPYSSSTYRRVEVNKTSGGGLTVNQALNADDLIIAKNGTLAANAALTAANLSIAQSESATFNELAAVTASYTDMAAAGNITFAKGCAFTPAATFNTTGTLTLNGATNPCNFTGGLTHTAGLTSLYGTLSATNAAITLGATTLNADTTIDAMTGTVTLGAISGGKELTFKNGGTLNLTGTVAASKINMTGAAPTLTGNGTTIPNLVYEPSDTTGAGLKVSDGNTFTNFSCSKDGAKITLSGANSFGTLTMTSGDGTLVADAAQTVTTLALAGTSETSPLTITNAGNAGSITIATNQHTGNFLNIDPDKVSINTGYYIADNSKFINSTQIYGQRNHWILMNKAMAFEWTGATDTDWGKPTNWNYNLVPGLANATGGVYTKGYPALISNAPVKAYMPATGAVSYSVGQLTINDATSSLRIFSASLAIETQAGVSDTADGTLTNKGTIFYTSTGRITNGAAFINDTSNGGTVDFAGTESAADLAAVQYHNLIVSGSGTYTAAAALTVLNDLTISGTGTFAASGDATITGAIAASAGNVFFNNGAGDSATSAATAAFTTTGTVSLGNTSGDSFTVTGALALPPTLGGLELAGTITAGGGITLSKDAALAADTTFASATSLGAPVNLAGAYTVTTNAALTTTSTNTLTLTNASLVNVAAVTGGNIIFEGTTAQTFAPDAASTYQSVTINKTNGNFTVNQALTATNFIVAQNGTLAANAALTAANLSIAQSESATFNELAAVTASYTDMAAAGNITFAKGCAFTPAATFNTTGTLTLNGATNACSFTGGLEHTDGPTILIGALSATNAAITLGATTLAADTTIGAGSGAVTIQGALETLNGSQSLVSSGTGMVIFDGTVGASNPPSRITTAGSATFNAATKVSGPVAVTGDGEFNGTTNVAGDIAIDGNASINGVTATTGSGKIAIGGNASINAATASASTITVNGATNVGGPSITSGGLQLYKDNITFNSNCAVIGTVQAAANAATSAAVTATFNNDVWLYSSAAATLGGNGGSLDIKGNLFFANETKNTSIASTTPAFVSAKNVLLLHGNLSLQANAALKSSQDMILLGAAYNIDDTSESTASQVTGLFAYNHGSRKKAASYTAAFPTICPDGTTAISSSYTGTLNVTGGATVSAGVNFYANGLAITGSGTWTLSVPDNNSQTAAFAEIYNSSISNCSATYDVAAAERNTVTSCSKIITTRPVIDIASAVYDDAIYISFKDSAGNPVSIENSNNEISAACSSVFNSAGAFAGTYIDADCQTSTNGTGDRSSFYIKSNYKWNTDAIGTSAGAAESTDRSGSHQTTIPYLNLPKALAGVYETLRDSSKNRIAHYYSVTPDTSAASAVAGKTFTAVVDKCAPVLIQVLTGQELHEAPASQKEYDAHNFVEFAYSEPVDISGGITSVAASDVNIHAADDLGGATNTAGGVTFAGLAAASSGKIEAALKTGSGSPHALYRKFSRTAGAASSDQEARIRLSVAGYVAGTISAGGNSYNNWTGYISSAETPTGTVTRISNVYIKDKSPDANSLTINSPTGHPLPILSVENSENELYGSWDVTPPSFAPVRINGTSTWNAPAYDGSQEFEFVGASYGTGTLSAIEVHWFDNEPKYNEATQWFSRVGWATASSATEYNVVKSYAADVRGGSRSDSDSANATTGGIRYSSVYNANNAFEYAIYGSESYVGFTQQIKGGAESSLFTYGGSDAGATLNPTGAEDGLYTKLLLDNTLLQPNTTFSMAFDSNACFITDLAGNRIQCGKVKMKSIDRTPPEFLMSAVPLGTNQMLVIFSKSINIGTLALYTNATTHDTVSALEYIPKALEFKTISGGAITEIGIEDVPAKCVFRNNKSTGIVVTLSKNAVLSNVTSGIFVNAKKSDTYKYDPLSGIDNASITYIQDAIGNYVIADSKHAFSDFAVNAVNPQYAYDNSLTDEGATTSFGLYQEGSWAVRDWNAEQKNYGTLSSNKEIIMQATLYDGSKQLPSGQKISAVFDSAPDFGSVSTKINENTGKAWRIWHPNITSDIFTSLAPKNNIPQFSVEGSYNDSGVVFDIAKSLSSSNWKNGDQVSFLFKMGDYTVDHYADGRNFPLYAIRLKDISDITSLDLWSFKIRTTTLQRGGVTILNNVIDLNSGEHTVVQVDMKEAGNLNVMVMTLDGNIITYLRHGYTEAGSHYYNWNGTNNGGSKVARGLYFVRVIGPGIDETRKVMCVK